MGSEWGSVLREMMNLHSEEFADISRLRTGWPYLKGITVSQQGIGEAGTRAVSRATSARSPRLPRVVYESKRISRLEYPYEE
jgi:hypothetical protein